jgi:hypothetical protein
VALILLALPAFGQVPVNVGPEPKTQFLDNSGVPLAFGIVCTYQAGTSTPFATYTDSTGSVMNANPTVLDAGGRANIWWQSPAYKVVLAGGGTCGSPSNLIWTVDNFQIGVFLNGNNTWTGTNTFSGNVVVNGTFTANSGGSLNGTFSGNPNFSGSPTFSGTIVASQFQSTVATGTPPLIVASTTEVANLNVAALDGCVTTGTPSAGQFLTASSATACGWTTASQLPGIVYSTPSSSVNASIGTVTMITVGGSDATYRFSFYPAETVVGASCAGSTDIQMVLTFQDPNAVGASTISAPANFHIASLGNGTVGPAFSYGFGALTFTPPFRAKTGTAIQYAVTFTAGGSCSPAPKYQIFPILEQLTSM